MTRVVTNIDPVNKTVTFTQAHHVLTAHLDPWPDTEEEILSQANAKLPPYEGDDPAQAVISFYGTTPSPVEEL